MDFKNIDIATGPVITDLNSADAAVALEAAATLAVALQSGAILLPTADGQLVLPAGVGLDDIKVSGRDLIIQMPDGTQMVVPDGAIFVPQIVVDGVAVPPLNIAALLIGQEPQPAAGRPQSSGGNFSQTPGDIGDPFGLGDLLRQLFQLRLLLGDDVHVAADLRLEVRYHPPRPLDLKLDGHAVAD